MNSGQTLDFRLLFEQAPGLFLVLTADPAFTILGASDAYLSATMTRRENIEGHGLFDIFPDNPDDAQATGTSNLRASLHRVLSLHRPDTMAIQKYDIRRPESEGGGFEERYWSPVNYPVFTPDKTVAFIIHRVEDVTDIIRNTRQSQAHSDDLQRRNEFIQAELIQRNQELRLRSNELAAALQERDRMFNMSLDMICTAGFDGFFKLVNPSFQRILGWSLGELTANPFMYFVHPDDHIRTEQAMTGLVNGAPLYDFENRYRCKNGSFRWMSWSSFPLLDQQLIYAIARDVTDRKVLEQSLQDINHELEAFSYSVSHDLRAPLRHIDGFMQLLKAQIDLSLDDKCRRYIRIIEDSARQMGVLIDELLAFSRMSRTSLVWTDVSLDALVRETLVQLEPDCRDRRIEWVTEPLPIVQGDRSMLKQVFINLLSNALKYSAQKEAARIEIKRVQPDTPDLATHTVISIRDNGAGFNMKYADKLFGVFQRLHSATEFEGTGIGLANVRRIITRHGGKTWAVGVEGEGATFFFSIPPSITSQHNPPMDIT